MLIFLFTLKFIVRDLRVEFVRLLVVVTSLNEELILLKKIAAFPEGALPPTHLLPVPQFPLAVPFQVKFPCAQTCPVHEKAKARTRARKHGFTKPKNTPRRADTPLLKARGLLF
jgi:hypothetical protein